MKAAILTADGFKLGQFDNPVAADDEILIKTSACGVCSGDVFVYKNRQRLSERQKRLGHEGSGTVVQMGRSVVNFKIGEIVTALGTPAYSEFFVAKSENAVHLPPTIDPQFALGEAIACCVHAGNRFGIKPGDNVAIVGCGFMGLICLQLAKLQGAGFICCIDPVLFRRHKALELLADISLSPFEISANEILKQYGEFDVIVEAAGTQSALDLCTDLVVQHGRIILVGYHQSNDGKRTVNMKRWNYKAIDVVNGHVRRQNEKVEAMCQGMELMASGLLTTEPLVSTYPLTNIEQAFRDLATTKGDLVKAVITMNED